MNLTVTFKLTKSDGTVVDSRDKGNPMEFVCGEGLVFPGLDKGVQGMSAGETRSLHMEGDDAFGARDEDKVIHMHTNQLPIGCQVGLLLRVTGPDGEDYYGKVVRLEGDKGTLDLNHPMAGEKLTMSLTLLSCEVAPELPPFEVETTSPGDNKTYPQKADKVTVHYAGELSNGVKFMSTRDRGEPLQFVIGLGEIIQGLDEGIALMSLGERATIRVPAVMAYGERGLDGIVPPNTDLVFDVELLVVS